MRARLLVTIVVLVIAMPVLAPRTTRAETPLTITLPEISARLTSDDPDLLILDASPLNVYRRGHLPGAIHVWWQDTMDWNDPVYGTILPQTNKQRERLDWLGSIGIGPTSHVVVYDDQGGYRAARIVWFLRFLGLDNASLLLADFDDWVAQGGIIDRSSPPVTARDVPAIAPRKGWYLTTPQLQSRLDSQSVQLVDVRTPEEQRWDVDGTLPLGRIPGSLALPWRSLLDPDSGQLANPDRLATIARAAGLNPARAVVLYATFGVDPALAWLGLRLAGFQDVEIYDRGWAEWSTTRGLPQQALESPATAANADVIIRDE